MITSCSSFRWLKNDKEGFDFRRPNISDDDDDRFLLIVVEDLGLDRLPALDCPVYDQFVHNFPTKLSNQKNLLDQSLIIEVNTHTLKYQIIFNSNREN